MDVGGQPIYQRKTERLLTCMGFSICFVFYIIYVTYMETYIKQSHSVLIPSGNRLMYSPLIEFELPDLQIKYIIIIQLHVIYRPSYWLLNYNHPSFQYHQCNLYPSFRNIRQQNGLLCGRILFFWFSCIVHLFG